MAKNSRQRFEERDRDYFEIEGIASTDVEDTYGEIIDQDGIDLSFVEDNLVSINIEHGERFPLPEMSVVGTVTDAEVREEGLWIRGKVYTDHQYANAIHRMLLHPDTDLQLSIELSGCIYGKGRKSNVVLGGTLEAVALTTNPANDGTYVKLMKSTRDPSLQQLIVELRRLNKIVYSSSQRQLRKKRVIVKVLKVS